MGVIYAVAQPNTYIASTTFIPQLSSGVSSSGSSLSSLASLAGFNIGDMQNQSEFPPSLYPQVINSIPFKIDLLSSEIIIDNNTILVKDYLLKKNSSFNFIGIAKKYTIGLPSLILSYFKKDDIKSFVKNSKIYSITKKDSELLESLYGLSLSINQQEGFITISFTDTNKIVAAQITQIAQSLLQEKIIEFKNKSSKETLDYALKQYSDKKDLFEKLQDERAAFVDQNINISSSLFQNKLNRIESEVNISQSIVQQLASQVEQAKLQVNKNTPVFTTIEPVSIPYKRASPKRSLIVITFAFLGLVFSIGFVLFKEPAMEIIKSIKS